MQLLLPFVQVSLELTHQLIAIGLRDLLHQTQLIRVPLFQLPILRKEKKKKRVTILFESHQNRQESEIVYT